MPSLALALTMLLAFQSAWADLPNAFHTEGRLTDASGDPLTGDVDIQLTLWDSLEPLTGNILYDETHAGITLSSGRFSLVVGEGQPSTDPATTNPYVLSTDTLESGAAYLQTTVTHDGTTHALDPLAQLLPVPYAMVAREAETIPALESRVADIEAGSLSLIAGATGPTGALNLYQNTDWQDGPGIEMAGDAHSETAKRGEVRFISGDGGGSNFRFIDYEDGSLTTNLIIDSQGKVTIGGSLPNYDVSLDVAGAVNVNGRDNDSTGGLSIDATGKLMQDVADAGNITEYDIWIQGRKNEPVDNAHGGDSRNLAILGEASSDTLRLNWNNEYKNGTKIDGNLHVRSAPEHGDPDDVSPAAPGNLEVDGDLHLDGDLDVAGDLDVGGQIILPQNSTYYGSVPIGTIIDWWRPAGSDTPVPDGFQICNGLAITAGPYAGSDTPNLSNKYMRGVTDPDEIGDTGGSGAHAHQVDPPIKTSSSKDLPQFNSGSKDLPEFSSGLVELSASSSDPGTITSDSNTLSDFSIENETLGALNTTNNSASHTHRVDPSTHLHKWARHDGYPSNGSTDQTFRTYDYLGNELSPFQHHGNGVGGEGSGIIPLSESDGTGDVNYYTQKTNLPSFYSESQTIDHNHSYSPGSHGHSFGSTAHVHSVNQSDHGHSLNHPSHSHTVEPGSHDHTVNPGSHDHTTNIPEFASASGSTHPPYTSVLKIMRIY